MDDFRYSQTPDLPIHSSPTDSKTDSRPRTPAFRWFKNGHEVDVGERFLCQFDDVEDTIALVFQNVTPDDAGLYTCVASTTSGKISCSAELSVQGEVHTVAKEPELPKIKLQMADVEVNDGSSAILEAKVTGYPKPQVTWYQGNEEIGVDERHRFLYEDEESYSLLIKSVKRTDAGEYTLQAVNHLGKAETSAKLYVLSTPKFRKELKDQELMTNDNLSLNVNIEAEPKPEVKWFKDGKHIKESERVKIINEKDGSHTLMIKKVKVEDSGNYSCVVDNTSGQKSSYSVVTVKCKLKELANIY